MDRPRLFLSAVSEELRTARQAVARTVRTLGFDPVSQDDFPTGYGELRQWLREQLDSCEGLIQLVGDGYGAEPPEVDPDYGRVSYTQFEFLYAYKQKKKTWVIVIGKDFPRDKAPDQLDLPRDSNHPDSTGYQTERRMLQQNYLAQLKQENHLRHTARNSIELENIVLKLQDELGVLRQKWEEWLRKDASFKARTQATQDRTETKLDKVAEMVTALYAASFTGAAAERTTDATLQAQRNEIEALRTQVQSGEVQHQAELTAAEEKYVAELAARDRAYAQEIVVFRKAVEDIAAMPDGVAALARFNAGDEPGALTVLDQLRAARDAARKKRVDLESAAECRRIATLALEARTKGKLTTAHVIARYEEVTRLDPSIHWDWVELGRLYQALGNLPGALRAAQGAVKTASDEREQSVANNAIGDVLVAQGQLEAAAQAYRDGLGIRKQLVASDASNTEWQRDLSISYNKLGDVAVAQGQLEAAAQAYRDGLGIAKQLVARDASNTQWQRDLSVSYERVGDVAVAQGQLEAAAQAYRDGLGIRKQLVASDASNTEWQRDLYVSYNKLGDVEMVQGDLKTAAQTYSAGLTIAKQLAARDPSNTEWQRDLSEFYRELGDLAEKQNTLSEARAYWKQAYDVLSSIDKRGLHLSPEDRQYLAILREKVRAGAQ